MQNPGITIHNLTLTYERRPAVHHVSGYFPLGSMTAIIGPNGGGKSTFLKSLAGLHPIDEGSIARCPAHELKDTAYLPQASQWDRQFPISVYDLAAQALVRERGFWRSWNTTQKARIQSALEQVNLWAQRHLTIDRLSLGQFQRALFARVIIQNAQLILLDEPLTGLDEPSIKDFFSLIHNWNKKGKTIIVVLHDRNLIQEHFENTIILSKEVQAWGSTATIFNKMHETPLPLSVPFILSDEECLR